MNKQDISADSLCPCGTGLKLTDCCLPRITGTAPAMTAEALMRSRYSAYVLANVDYLAASWHASTRPEKLDVSGNIEWLGLDILACKAGLVADIKGTVEFIARYNQHGVAAAVRECSRFVKEQGTWFYVDGDLKTAAEPGRNAPCQCGSGKKYKKCCGR